MKCELSIIIPTKDRGEVFNQTLNAALSSIAGRNAEIIVINDSDIPLNGIQIPDKVLVFQNLGKGVASARNFGMSKASSDLLLFLDDDILITQTLLEQLHAHYKTDPHNIYIPNWFYPNELNNELNKSSFGRFMLKHKLNSLKGWLNSIDWSEIELMEIKNGASFCLLINRKLFLSINGYNEKFPHAGAEDYDFCERLKNNGIRFFIDPKAIVYHNEADRVSLIGWLNRKKRDSSTKCVAYRLGYSEFEIKYSILKSSILSLVYNCRSVFFAILKITPNKVFFDLMYNKLVLMLCAGYIYKGYKEI